MHCHLELSLVENLITCCFIWFFLWCRCIRILHCIIYLGRRQGNDSTGRSRCTRWDVRRSSSSSTSRAPLRNISISAFSTSGLRRLCFSRIFLFSWMGEGAKFRWAECGGSSRSRRGGVDRTRIRIRTWFGEGIGTPFLSEFEGRKSFGERFMSLCWITSIWLTKIKVE